MKPRSGLAVTEDAFDFFEIIERDTESVRDFTTVSAGPSRTATESLQPRTPLPIFVTHPDRRSLGPPPELTRAAQLLSAMPALSVHALTVFVSLRRETEYMRAASEETATANNNTATSSSPIMKPRARRVPE